MLTYEECKTAVFMVGQEGGELQAVDTEGEILWSLGVEPGKHTGASVVSYLEPEDTLRFQGAVTAVMPTARRAERMRFGPGATESGANPDYRPSSADAHRRQLEHTMRKISRMTMNLERRQNQLEDLEKRRHLADVIEEPKEKPEPKKAPEPEPTPEPKPEPATQPAAEPTA